ncbi:MAG TPA: amino acid transporter [Myxococcota bacterium]|nr:amino acid transporter [Myxococcota bacterium]
MSAERVIELLDRFAGAGVRAIVDGGWGVDALLRMQTREHDDLDLVVALADCPRVLDALAAFGFEIREDERPVRFVIANSRGEQLDLHTVTFDADGGGNQPQPSGGSFRYPPEGFVTGEIAGRAVECVSAPVQLRCHLGYAPTEKDARDVLSLCRRFGLRIPDAYESWTGTSAPVRPRDAGVPASVPAPRGGAGRAQ